MCEFIQGVEIWNSWQATRCLEQLPATLSSLENHCMIIFEKCVKQTTTITTTRTEERKDRPTHTLTSCPTKGFRMSELI